MSDDTTIDIQRLINAHVQIFGSEIATSAVKKVKGLQISPDGKITKIIGDPKDLLIAVVGSYYAISGNLSYQILNTVVTV